MATDIFKGYYKVTLSGGEYSIDGGYIDTSLIQVADTVDGTDDGNLQVNTFANLTLFPAGTGLVGNGDFRLVGTVEGGAVFVRGGVLSPHR